MKTQLSFTLLFVTTLLGMKALGQQSASTPSVPAKLDVAPVSTVNQPGTQVPVLVKLQDGNGRPVSSNRNVNAEVKVEQPSGESKTYSVILAPGESVKQIDIPVDQSGLTKLTVKERDERLIGGSNFALVRRSKKSATKKQMHPSEILKESAKPSKSTEKGPGATLRFFDRLHERRAKLVYAALAMPQVPAPDPSSAAQFVLTASGEDAYGGTRADGTTCARVQVYYMGSDDLQRDIQIWLSPSNGDVTPNPIVIHKGSAFGSACWTSAYPIAAATLRASIYPSSYTFGSAGGAAAPGQVTHKFTDNIAAIQFENPPKSITIVDTFNLSVSFRGPNGQPTAVSDKRELHFSADSALLKLNPLQTFVQPGGYEASTILTPTFFGKSSVQVSTPLYQPATWVIEITWLGVLFASLLGGLLGGLLAWINSQGKLWMRIVVGLIVGLVASWAYVIVGLPKVETAFLHNQLSVFFVALLVGISGVKGITFIAGKFGLPTF